MGGTYFNVPIPSNVLATNLFNTNGKAISLNTFKGKYVVIAPFLTSCQEVCPMTSANMLAVANAINASKMGSMASVLEVSVDSERDSASRLKAYQALFADNSWTIAGGSATNLKKFWGYFGVMATKDPYTANDMKKLPADWQTGKKDTFDISHTDEVVIVGPNQKWEWLDLGTPNIEKNPLPAKLKTFLDDDGISNLQKPEEPTWTVNAVTSALSHEMGMKIG
jgi:protein SCO1/2